MAGYHRIRTSELTSTVDQTVENIKKLQKKHEFKQIVCTGISGQSIAWPVGYLTGIPVAVVRRKNEESHGSRVENFDPNLKFIILDDMVDTGKTLTRVLDYISNYHRGVDLDCVGVYCYADSSTRPTKTIPTLSGDKTVNIFYPKD